MNEHLHPIFREILNNFPPGVSLRDIDPPTIQEEQEADDRAWAKADHEADCERSEPKEQ